MENPPDPRPVYEADQVLTFYDLMAIRNGYVYQYRMTPWYKFRRRLMFLMGVGAINEMIHWLSHGKPKDGMKCRGGHNEY